MREETQNKWKTGYYIATYVLAIVAISGFIYSIRSTRKLSETLRTVQTGIETMIEPIVTFSEYKWVNDESEREFSCENPPKGIYVFYKNVSNVPISIYGSTLKVYYGTKELDEIVKGLQGGGPSILPPGQELSDGTIQKKLFQKWLSRPKEDIYTPPHLNILLEIEYSRLGSERRYFYSTHREIYFDCKQAGFRQHRALQENVKLSE